MRIRMRMRLIIDDAMMRMQTKQLIMNAFFHKHNEQLISYKEEKHHPGGPPYDGTKYEVLEYVLVEERWRNTITNIEADPMPNINSDHYPIIVTMQLKLQASYKRTRGESITNRATRSSGNNTINSWRDMAESQWTMNTYAHGCTKVQSMLYQRVKRQNQESPCQRKRNA